VDSIAKETASQLTGMPKSVGRIWSEDWRVTGCEYRRDRSEEWESRWGENEEDEAWRRGEAIRGKEEDEGGEGVKEKWKKTKGRLGRV
jgi:hypothetical protein